jgi:hypothetical protein
VEGVDAEVWDNFGRALDILMRGLEKHKARLADGSLPLPQGVKKEDLSKALVELQELWKVLREEQLHTHQGAAALDLEAFLEKHGPVVMKATRELVRLGWVKLDLKKLDESIRTLRLEPGEVGDTRAVVTLYYGKPVKVKIGKKVEGGQPESEVPAPNAPPVADAPDAAAPAPETEVPPPAPAAAPEAPTAKADVATEGDVVDVKAEEELFEEKQLGVEVAFVRVDGYWVPEQLALAWGPALEKFSGHLDDSLSEFEAQRQDWLARSRKALDAASRFEESGDFMALLGVLPR